MCSKSHQIIYLLFRSSKILIASEANHKYKFKILCKARLERWPSG